MFKDIDELIDTLKWLREMHGNIELKYNDVSVKVIGVSYKYLLIESNFLQPHKKEPETDV